jgi:hypothetical protein
MAQKRIGFHQPDISHNLHRSRSHPHTPYYVCTIHASTMSFKARSEVCRGNDNSLVVASVRFDVGTSVSVSSGWSSPSSPHPLIPLLIFLLVPPRRSGYHGPGYCSSSPVPPCSNFYVLRYDPRSQYLIGGCWLNVPSNAVSMSLARPLMTGPKQV